MIHYIIRRLLLTIPTMIGITVLVFLVMALSPGGLAAGLRNESGNMRPEARKKIEDYYKKRYGLDRPLHEQYLRWMNQVLPIGFKEPDAGFPKNISFGLKTPDLGESLLLKRPVIDVIVEALPVTVTLNLITVPIIYAVSITTGIYAARRRGALFDNAWGTTSLALWSIPSMWAGVMLLGFLASREYVQFFPPGGQHDTLAMQMPFLPRLAEDGFQRGWLLDAAWHLVLPVICLTYAGFAFLSKLMRASMLENLSSDFARTARAKGLSEHVVLFRHVLSNSLLPLITMAANIIPGLFGGSIIVESIFGLNGMGKLMLAATYSKDRELIMSETLVVGIIAVVCLLIADLLYVVADPRVSYE